MLPRPNVDSEIDKLIKRVQRFYADEMEYHGFGRKTFQIETNTDGNTIVHHVVGKFAYADYLARNSDHHEETLEQIDIPWWSIPIYMVETRGKKDLPGIGCGSANYTRANINCWRWSVIVHELGHSFDLPHDFRSDSYIMSYGPSRSKLSRCAAEWLNVHPFFNVGQPPMTKAEWSNNHTFSLGLHDQLTQNERRGIKMLPPSLESPPNVIRLRFEVTDPDGLHHALLQTGYLLFCKSLSGESSTVEFVTNSLGPKDRWVELQVIDVRGNTTSATYSNINIMPLLPPPEVISIADVDLSAALRKQLRLAPDDAITTHIMLNLKDLFARDLEITNLTGLEYAQALTRLFLPENHLSDISTLAGLTQLTLLNLHRNDISDISPLAGLTQLADFILSDNNISDVSALAGLTQLVDLSLSNNDISDVSPLLALINLRDLHLEGNPLSFASINTHIPALQAKGIEVKFDNVAHPALVKISDDTQEGAAGALLTSPFVVEVQDEKGQPMKNVPVTFTIHAGGGILSPTTTKTHAEGKARTFLTLGWIPGPSIVRVTADGIPSYVQFMATGTVLTDRLATDVNGDGAVDVEDLLLVAASFGTAPAPGTFPDTDVNSDGEINHEDVQLVLAALEGAPAAPSLDAQWTAASLQRWIAEAKQHDIGDAIFQRGIAVLEQLLADLLPKETTLRANYPNPFNPETWIPYQLSKPAEVALHIYAVNGTLVRTLALGHQPAGTYQGKSRAAYWDGRNEQGEHVASGVYFYTLSADDFSATRKMLIRK